MQLAVRHIRPSLLSDRTVLPKESKQIHHVHRCRNTFHPGYLYLDVPNRACKTQNNHWIGINRVLGSCYVDFIFV